MRVLVVSDTHGRLDNLKRALKAEKDLSFLIHCGDVEEQEEEVRAAAKIPCLIVRGNNDYSTRLAFDETVELAGHRIFVTHGHTWHVERWESSLWDLCDEAKRRGARVAIFGHTHHPIIMERDGVLLINPGSLAYNAFEEFPSYITFHIVNGERNGCKIHFVKPARHS